MFSGLVKFLNRLKPKQKPETKSEIVARRARELGLRVIEAKVADANPRDLCGLPIPVTCIGDPRNDRHTD